MSCDATHNVLGRYCWTCQVKTEAGIPGWPPNGSGSVKYSPWATLNGEGVTVAVIWANGDQMRTKDGSVCSVCGLYCANPVERTVTAQYDGYWTRTMNHDRGDMKADSGVRKIIVKSFPSETHNAPERFKRL